MIGFADRLARRLDEGTLRCELVHNRRGVLARESVVQRASLLVAAEVREIESSDKRVTTILSLATAVQLDWLREFYPEDFCHEPRVFYDASARRVLAEEPVSFRGLILSTKRVDPPPADAAARLLAEEVLAGRLQLPKWDHAVEQWILRLNLLSQWCPDLQLPPLADADRRQPMTEVPEEQDNNQSFSNFPGDPPEKSGCNRIIAMVINMNPMMRSQLFSIQVLLGEYHKIKRRYPTIFSTSLSHKSRRNIQLPESSNLCKKSDAPFNMTNDLCTRYPPVASWGTPQRRGLAEGATTRSVLKDMKHFEGVKKMADEMP